jgi:uncharacterized protein YecE (DUF72 family)
MDFGQTLDPAELSRIHFELPALASPEEEAQLARVAKAAARSPQVPEIYVGIPIFSYAPWVGSFYPEGTEATDFLRAYSKQLRTVELNSTFYAIPPAETFSKWKASVGPDFKFCPKFPKSISHSLEPNHPDLKIFLERLKLFGENLGVCFLQLPHYFSAHEKDKLLGLLSALPRDLRTVVELRNNDFFSGQRLKPEWIENLATRFAGSVSIDTPLERGIAQVSLTSSRTMIRFLGANFHDSDFLRLKEWAKRIALWHVTGLKEIYFLLHEPDNGLAPLAAKRMIGWINEELEALSSSYRLPVLEWHSFFDELPGGK